MEEPTVGRIVHFVGQGGTGKQSVCRAAIVTAVKAPDAIGLCVFNPQMPLFKHGVTFNGDATKVGTWHWPEPLPVDQVAGDEA